MSGQYRRVLRGYDLCEYGADPSVRLLAPSSEEFDFFAHFLVAISDIDLWEEEWTDKEWMKALGAITVTKQVTRLVRGYFHYIPATLHTDPNVRCDGLLFEYTSLRSDVKRPDQVKIRYFQAVGGPPNVCYELTITRSKHNIWIRKLVIGEDGAHKTARQWFEARCQLRGEDYVFTAWRVVDGEVPKKFEDTSKFDHYLARFASVYQRHPVGKSCLNTVTLKGATVPWLLNRCWLWDVEKNERGEMRAELYYTFGGTRMQILSLFVTDRVVSCSETLYLDEHGKWFSGDDCGGHERHKMILLETVASLPIAQRRARRVEWVYEGIFNEHLYLARVYDK